MGVELAMLVAFAWFYGFLGGWGVNGMRLTKRHIQDLREIKEQLIRRRGVD